MYKEQYEIANGRANVYRFLARFFVQAPDEEFVGKVLHEETLGWISVLFSDEAVSQLHEFQEIFGEMEFQKLAVEYWALFDVPGKRYIAPYESVYLRDSMDASGKPTGLVYGPSTYGVIQAYQQAGVEISPEFLDLPDHIGMELEFLRFLCEQEAKRWQESESEEALKYLNWQSEFLKAHLALWVDALCDKMASLATFGFYRAAAMMTKEYIAKELLRITNYELRITN